MRKPPGIQLLTRLRGEVRSFVRQELLLVKTELGEKFAHYRSGLVASAIGTITAYSALIVLLTGLGFLLALLFIKIGLSGFLARFLGFLVIGGIAATAGSLMLLASLKALSKQSLIPQRTIHTVRRIKPIQPATKVSVNKEIRPRPSQEIEADVLATEKHLTMTLEQVTSRANPVHYLNAAVARIQEHPYRWSLAALGAGFVGSLLLFRGIKGSNLPWIQPVAKRLL